MFKEIFMAFHFLEEDKLYRFRDIYIRHALFRSLLLKPLNQFLIFKNMKYIIPKYFLY